MTTYSPEKMTGLIHNHTSIYVSASSSITKKPSSSNQYDCQSIKTATTSKNPDTSVKKLQKPKKNQ